MKHKVTLLPGLKFVHLKNNTFAHSFGYVATPIEGGMSIEYASAFANPRDEYSKARAREIINGRLTAARERWAAAERVRHTGKIIFDGPHPKTAEDWRNLEFELAKAIPIPVRHRVRM